MSGELRLFDHFAFSHYYVKYFEVIVGHSAGEVELDISSRMSLTDSNKGRAEQPIH